MKTVPGFTLRALAGEYILVGESLAQVNFNKMIALNASAAYLWQEIDGKEFTPDDLKKLLLDKYEVDEETAAKDSVAIAKSWIEAGVVTEEFPELSQSSP